MRDFDTKTNQTFKFLMIVWGIGVLLSLGLIGFIVWVIIKVMAHLGVI